MIRPLTLICAMIAAIAGGYLYHVKHQTQLLERGIARTNQAIDATRERTGVLRAEWTLMNDPERLAELAGQHLKLATVAPRQFTTAADLGARLPAVRALPIQPENSTDEPDGEADNPPSLTEASLPLPPPPTPPLPASPAAARVAAAPIAPRAPPQAAPATPVSAPVSAPASAPASAIASAPAAPVTRAAARPETARATPPAPVPASTAHTGSALGMARSIVAPPVPVGGPGANGDIQLTRGN